MINCTPCNKTDTKLEDIWSVTQNASSVGFWSRGWQLPPVERIAKTQVRNEIRKRHCIYRDVGLHVQQNYSRAMSNYRGDSKAKILEKCHTRGTGQISHATNQTHANTCHKTDMKRQNRGYIKCCERITNFLQKMASSCTSAKRISNYLCMAFQLTPFTNSANK